MTTTTPGKLALPFTVGTPQQFESLWLVPPFAAGEPRAEYVGLDEAVAHGFVVREVDDHGEVNSLLVENPLELPVILYEGEELVGAKQNRILHASMLVGAKSQTLVSVSCVERGRWAYHTREFAPAPRAAHPDVRRASHDGAGQAEVWRLLAAKAARLDVQSPTEARGHVRLARGPAREVPLRAAATGRPVRRDRVHRRPRHLCRLGQPVRRLGRAAREARARLRPRRD